MEDIDVVDLTKKEKLKKFFCPDFYKSFLSIILYYFVFNNFAEVIMLPLKNILKENFPGKEAIGSAIVNVSIYGVILIALLLINKGELKKCYNKIKDTSRASLFFFVSLIVMFVVNIVAALTSRMIINLESTNQETINSTLSNPYAYMIYTPCVVIMGPLVEEFIFRKSYFGVFKNNYLALVISSVVFGAMHITTSYPMLAAVYPPVQAFGYMLAIGIPYFAMGFTFGMIYIKSDRNLLASTAVHIFNNFTATCLALLII